MYALRQRRTRGEVGSDLSTTPARTSSRRNKRPRAATSTQDQSASADSVVQADPDPTTHHLLPGNQAKVEVVQNAPASDPAASDPAASHDKDDIIASDRDRDLRDKDLSSLDGHAWEEVIISLLDDQTAASS